MRTFHRSFGLLVVSAAFTFACGGSGGANLAGPTPILNAEPALDLSGAWQGVFRQSGGQNPSAPPYKEPYRQPYGPYVPGPANTTMRFSLAQSGTEVRGRGEVHGVTGCMLNSFEVTGSVTAGSFSLNLTSSARPGAVVHASGASSGGALEVTYSSSSSACQGWHGGSSLNREP